jgi:S1-C subfamily serine protease
MDDFSNIVIHAVEKIKNAVVKIDVYTKRGGHTVPAGTGSGFVFSSDGLIFTNSHVISVGEKQRVTLLDGSEQDADVVGKDPDTDIAIIKIYGNGYSVAELGGSYDLKIGQLVIVIGNPLGYQQSVSTGVISGVGRTLRTATGTLIDHVLQTDAPLNPGNSGGPLITWEAKVVGISTAIILGAQGMSFAIDIDTAKEVAKYLIKDGRVIKAYLGIMMQEIEIHPRIRNFHQLPLKKGLFITGIQNNSPAKRANLMAGDIIIEFDGEAVGSSAALFRLLTGEKIFKPTKIKVIRKTEIKELDIFPVEKK